MNKRVCDPTIVTSAMDTGCSFFIGTGLLCDVIVRSKYVQLDISSLYSKEVRHYRYPLDSGMIQHIKYLRMNFPRLEGKAYERLRNRTGCSDSNELRYRRAIYDYLQLLPEQLHLIDSKEWR